MTDALVGLRRISAKLAYVDRLLTPPPVAVPLSYTVRDLVKKA